MGTRMRSLLACRVMYVFLLRPFSSKNKKSAISQKNRPQIGDSEKTNTLDTQDSTAGTGTAKDEERPYYESETANPDPIGQKWVSAGRKAMKSAKVEKTHKGKWDMAKVVEKVWHMEKMVENKELWEYFALLLDRICMYIHIIFTVMFFATFIQKLSYA